MALLELLEWYLLDSKLPLDWGSKLLSAILSSSSWLSHVALACLWDKSCCNAMAKVSDRLRAMEEAVANRYKKNKLLLNVDIGLVTGRFD